MKRRAVSLVASCVVGVALLLASCAPATTTPTPAPTPTPTSTPTPGPEKVTVKMTMTDGTVVEKLMERPKYGGTVTHVVDRALVGFDEALVSSVSGCLANRLVYDNLWIGDWSKGPSGTDECGFNSASFPGLQFVTGALAESWEMPDDKTLVFHIRKGVHFQDKPPVNGRELTADDVVYSIMRIKTTPTAEVSIELKEMESVTAPDKWTVIIKASSRAGTGLIARGATSKIAIVPREMVQKYGDLRMWENQCGTGPFYLVDYVSQSSTTFKRNPNCWMKDPFFPENQLPYVDSVKWLFIADRSTTLAAIRTAKIDKAYNIPLEDGKSLMVTNPELQNVTRLEPSVRYAGMPITTKPFDDVRVRRALNMAIDFKTIVRDLYGGYAEAIVIPTAPTPDQIACGYWIPPEKLPPDVQEIYAYHPDKAKQLLAEAGYPNGFKTEVMCLNEEADVFSVYKNYWSKIGVDVEIRVKDKTVLTSEAVGKKYQAMITRLNVYDTPYTLTFYAAGNQFNTSLIDDPRINDLTTLLFEKFFEPAEQVRLLREQIPYILSQAWYIQLPLPYTYTFWQPWLKNFHGEFSVGRTAHENWTRWVWIDQELKRAMTGSK